MKSTEYISLLEDVYVHALNDIYTDEEQWPSIFQRNIGVAKRGKVDSQVEIQTILPITVDASWSTKESTFAILYVNQGELILSFRGTLHLSEWMKDLTLNRKELVIGSHSIKVHSGFLSVFRAWHERNLHTIQQWVKKDQKITVLGHSLGGTCAALFGFYYPELVEKLVLFGTPKWANKPMSAFHEFEIENYRNPLDPVPSLPPTSSFVSIADPIDLISDQKKASEGWLERLNAHFLSSYRMLMQ